MPDAAGRGRLRAVEVSAYARPGRHCAHNLNYWQFGDYLGLGIGAGAHGKLTLGASQQVLRRWKVKQPTDYVLKAGTAAAIGGDDVLDAARLPFNFMLKALRLNAGVPMAMFEARTGLPRSAIEGRLALARARGWIEDDAGRITPTELGRPLHQRRGRPVPGPGAAGAARCGLSAPDLPWSGSPITLRALMAAATHSDPGAPRTLAAVDVPPRVRRVLENIRQTVASDLGRQLQVVLHEAEVELGQLAERARGSQADVAYSEALRSVRQQGAELISTFIVEQEAELARLHASRVSHRLQELPLRNQGLSLVDDTELSEGAVLSDIATRSDLRNSLALQLLGQRFGVLAGTPAFDAEHLPVGPHALCHALRAAATQLALPLHARLVLYRHFDKVALAHFPALLETLNTRLAGEGILPHLSFVPVRVRPAAPGVARAAFLESAPANAQPARAGSAGLAAPASGLPGTTQASGPPSDGFASLQDLLARRRLLLAKFRHGGKDERVRQTLARDELLGALRRMRSYPGKIGTPFDIRQTLLAQARQLHGHGLALGEAERDGFELFGLFLGQLQRELRSDSPGEALVQRLKLPLLQLALRDHRFFIDPAHPARALLDAVSQAGARWLAEDDFDPQWLGLLERAVGTVEQDPDAGDDTFVAANHALQGGLQAAARKHKMTERRHVEAARGRERLELARRRASSEIAHLIAGRQLPRFHSMLLEQAWTDVLSLTLLRSGEASDAWRDTQDTTRAIVEAISGDGAREPDPALLAKVQGALVQVGYHAEDAGAIARQLAHGHGEDADLASRTELVVQLKARARLGQGQLAHSSSSLAARTAAEQAAHARLSASSEGRWIDLHDPAQDSVVRRRLAWMSGRTGQTLLLNRRSLRIEGPDLDGMARRMAAGELQLVVLDLNPAELAWQATLSNLHHIADDPPALRETGHEP